MPDPVLVMVLIAGNALLATLGINRREKRNRLALKRRR
jgi:hypothetical protein